MYPGNTSTLNQGWNNVDCQHLSTLFQRWYLVENESWADVYLSTLFQRWQNNVETMLIELFRFNVDKPTLFQRWNLVENESWANVYLSTLSQRWQNKVERITSIQCWWPNVVSMFIFDWKGKLSQPMFIDVEKIALKHLCQNLFYLFTRKWLNNKTKLSFQV